MIEKEKTLGMLMSEDKINEEGQFVYVVLELAYYDEFLSAVDVIGTYKSLSKAKRTASKVNGKRNDYYFQGVVLKTILG